MLITLIKKIKFCCKSCKCYFTSLVTPNEFRPNLSHSTRKSSNIEEKFWESPSSSPATSWDGELRQILLAVGSSPGMRNCTQHVEPVPESKEQLMELLSHSHQPPLFSFSHGPHTKGCGHLPWAPSKTVSYDLDSDLSFVSNNCISTNLRSLP